MDGQDSRCPSRKPSVPSANSMSLSWLATHVQQVLLKLSSLETPSLSWSIRDKVSEPILVLRRTGSRLRKVAKV